MICPDCLERSIVNDSCLLRGEHIVNQPNVLVGNLCLQRKHDTSLYIPRGGPQRLSTAIFFVIMEWVVVCPDVLNLACLLSPPFFFYVFARTFFGSAVWAGRGHHGRDHQERRAPCQHQRANVRQDPGDKQRRRAEDEPAVRHAAGEKKRKNMKKNVMIHTGLKY